MHICFIADEFPLPGIKFGGIGTFLISYCKILIDNGHQVTVVGTSKENYNTVVNGITIIYDKRSYIRGLSWYYNTNNISKTIFSLHNENPIDIIEAQESGFAFIKIPKGIPKIIRMHGGHYFFTPFENKKINIRKAFQERRSFKNCDGVIATSEFVKNQTLKFIDFSNKKCEVINNPILFDLFHPADLSKCKINSAVFAGTICEKKGIRQLCLAIPEIIKEIPDFHLFAYGRDWFYPDGTSYKKWLLNQLSEEIKSRITFREPVKYEDLPSVYEIGEICVFPSHIEVQGLVAPEAMSMKKPVIFTKYGPGPETIDDEVNGWLCEPREVESIAKTIIKVFKSRNRFKEVGDNARKKVIEKFSPETIYNKNIRFYNELKTRD